MNHDLIRMLEDARNRLIGFIGRDCECDNTHAAVDRKCCLCEYKDALDRAKASPRPQVRLIVRALHARTYL